MFLWKPTPCSGTGTFAALDLLIPEPLEKIKDAGGQIS